MKPSKQQHKQSKSKVAPVNTTAFTSHWGVTPQRDEYKTPKDQIWRDVVRHERILEKNWNENWIEKVEEPTELSSCTETAVRQVINHNTSLPFYQLKPSPGLPVKASGIIGWRASDHENSMDFFRTQCTPPKKRFVQEQYGYYRIMKYFKPDAKRDEDPMPLPQKIIKPIIDRILC